MSSTPDPSRTAELPAAPVHTTEPLPDLPLAAVPARRWLLFAAVAALVAWALVATLVLGAERAAHHSTKAALAERTATVAQQEREIAELRREANDLRAQLREAESSEPGKLDCTTAVNGLKKLVPSGNLDWLIRLCPDQED